MINKIKTLNTVYVIIAAITICVSFLFLYEISFAEEIEITDGKPIIGRAIVELIKDVTNLTELENDSDLIIKGIIQPEKENLMVNDNLGYTNTKVLVTEVLKGNKNLLNQTIVYREPYFETTINGVTGYVVDANYKPAIINNEYVLFLNNYTGDYELYKGVYSMRYYEKGKYPLNNNIKNLRTNTSNFVDSLSNEELNISSYYETTVYRDIYKELLNKYILN